MMMIFGKRGEGGGRLEEKLFFLVFFGRMRVIKRGNGGMGNGERGKGKEGMGMGLF